MNFSNNLKELRIRNNLNQKQLADLLNTSQQHISQLEKKQREPNLSDIISLAKIFQVPIDLLIQDHSLSNNIQNLDEQLNLLIPCQPYTTKLLLRDLLILLSK